MANEDQNFEKFILPHADLQPAALLAVEDPLPVYFKEYLEGGNVKTPSYTPESVNTRDCSGFWRHICADHLISRTHAGCGAHGYLCCPWCGNSGGPACERHGLTVWEERPGKFLGTAADGPAQSGADAADGRGPGAQYLSRALSWAGQAQCRIDNAQFGR